MIKSLGANMIPYGGGVDEQIRAILPDGVHAIFDLAGGDGQRAVAELLGDRSKLISAGDMATVTELGGKVIERDGSRRVQHLVAAMVVDGRLDPHVEDVIEFEKAADALAAVEVGHARGKVVVRIS